MREVGRGVEGSVPRTGALCLGLGGVVSWNVGAERTLRSEDRDALRSVQQAAKRRPCPVRFLSGRRPSDPSKRASSLGQWLPLWSQTA